MNNKAIAFALVGVTMCILTTFAGCIGADNNVELKRLQYITKGLADIGFIVTVPYDISITETVSWASNTHKEVNRDVDITLIFGTPEKEDDRGLFDSATVKYWNYDDRVGDSQNSYITGDAFTTKYPSSFVEYKSMYYTESIDSSLFGNIQLDNRAGEYAFNAGLFGFTALDSSLYTGAPMIGLDGYQSSLAAIDMTLWDNIELDTAFFEKFGINYDELNFIDDLQGKNFLSQYSTSGYGISSSFLSGGISPVGSWDFKGLGDALSDKIAKETEIIHAEQLPAIAWVDVTVLIDVKFLSFTGNYSFNVPLPILLKPIGERLNWMADSIHNPGYDHKNAQKVWRNSDCLYGNNKWNGFDGLPLSGNIPFFIPFRRLISHTNLIHVSVQGNGVTYRDTYNRDMANIPSVPHANIKGKFGHVVSFLWNVWATIENLRVSGWEFAANVIETVAGSDDAVKFRMKDPLPRPAGGKKQSFRII